MKIICQHGEPINFSHSSFKRRDVHYSNWTGCSDDLTVFHCGKSKGINYSGREAFTADSRESCSLERPGGGPATCCEGGGWWLQWGRRPPMAGGTAEAKCWAPSRQGCDALGGPTLCNTPVQGVVVRAEWHYGTWHTPNRSGPGEGKRSICYEQKFDLGVYFKNIYSISFMCSMCLKWRVSKSVKWGWADEPF